MDVHSCLHCGSPILAGAETCPTCKADQTGATEAPYPRELRPGSNVDGFERYEIPWFDLPMAFRVIRDPSEVSPLSADATIRKYATRALILSAVGFAFSFSPLFFAAAALPALLGVIWALMVARVGRQNHTRTRRGISAVAFGLGLLACVNVVLSLFLTLVVRVGGQ